jgi:hypothetical protein
MLERGIIEVTWEDEAAATFLVTCVAEVSEFSELHNTSTSNLSTIKKMIAGWRGPALFSRKAPRNRSM